MARKILPKDCLDVPSLLRAITSALERKRLEEQVAHYTDELREKNMQMEADLNMARVIQQAFLPHRYPTFPADANEMEKQRCNSITAINPRAPWAGIFSMCWRFRTRKRACSFATSWAMAFAPRW